jgi:hypothetical protein
MRACVRACVRACARAPVRVCVRKCVRATYCSGCVARPAVHREGPRPAAVRAAVRGYAPGARRTHERSHVCVRAHILHTLAGWRGYRRLDALGAIARSQHMHPHARTRTPRTRTRSLEWHTSLPPAGSRPTLLVPSSLLVPLPSSFLLPASSLLPPCSPSPCRPSRPSLDHASPPESGPGGAAGGVGRGRGVPAAVVGGRAAGGRWGGTPGARRLMR